MRLNCIYLDWQHRQCSGLVKRCRVPFPTTALSFVAQHLYAASGSQGITASQLDLPSKTPLYVTGWCQLQLGVAQWTTSVA